MLTPVLDSCDRLQKLAEAKSWKSFVQELEVRDELVKQATQAIDLDDPPQELYSQVQDFQQKNKALIDLVRKEQKGLVDALSKFTKGDKAKFAYTRMK